MNGPFDVDGLRSGAVAGLEFVCPSNVPLPLTDISAPRPYSDSYGTIKDDGAELENRQIESYYRQYSQQLHRFAEQYLRNTNADAAAGCAVHWMAAWAHGNALLGTMAQEQAEAHRRWAIIPIVSAFLLVRDGATVDADERQRVEQWFGRIGEAITPYFYERRQSAKNNHLSWGVAAVMLIGVAADRPDLVDWAENSFVYAVNQIGRDGTIPHELARYKRARHYHFFTAIPLVLAAETAARNGWNWYGYDGNAIDRLIRLLAASVNSDTIFREKTGGIQIGPDGKANVKTQYLTWMDIYYSRFRMPELKPYLSIIRSAQSPWTGGDLTFYTGRAGAID